MTADEFSERLEALIEDCGADHPLLARMLSGVLASHFAGEEWTRLMYLAIQREEERFLQSHHGHATA
jgi:hypothetical protein